jgi:integrase
MVRHSKERVLSEREFERLLQAIERIDDPWYREVTRFIVIVSGRLGLRAGEIAHMHEDWVDFREGIITIPDQHDCTKGEDGGPCGYCRSLAKSVVKHAVPTIQESKLALLEQGQLVDLGMTYQELLAAYRAYDENQIPEESLTDRVNDALAIGHDGQRDPWDAYDELCERAEAHRDRHDVTLDEAIEQYWIPKTEASAREVPFDFSSRAEMAIEDFFDDRAISRYPNSRTTVNRRVDDALEAAGFDKNHSSPHGLRATAATFHAGRGLEAIPLQSMFGWVQLSTAMKYINSSGTNTQRALNSVH